MRRNRLLARSLLSIGALGISLTGCTNGPQLTRQQQLSQSSLTARFQNPSHQVKSLSNTVLEKPFNATPEASARIDLAYGEMLQKAGKADQATAYYEQAMKSDPGSIKAMLALARNYDRIGRPGAALEIYRKAEQKHRKNPSLYNDLGLHLANQGDFPSAVESLKRATKLDGDQELYHNNLGLVYAATGDYDNAYEEFRKAIGPAKAHYNLAWMLVRKGHSATAREHLQLALQLMPKLDDAQNLLASIPTSSANVKIAQVDVQVSPERPTPVVDQPVVVTQDPVTPEPSPAPAQNRPPISQPLIDFEPIDTTAIGTPILLDQDVKVIAPTVPVTQPAVNPIGEVEAETTSSATSRSVETGLRLKQLRFRRPSYYRMSK